MDACRPPSEIAHLPRRNNRGFSGRGKASSARALLNIIRAVGLVCRVEQGAKHPRRRLNTCLFGGLVNFVFVMFCDPYLNFVVLSSFTYCVSHDYLILYCHDK